MIREVIGNKRDYLPLLLLADEQENMIDQYLDWGIMFVLEEDGHVIGEFVVTDEGDGIIEIQNLAVAPEYQHRGYGKRLVSFVADRYRDQYNILQIGTGDSPLTVPFYESCGLAVHHVIPNYILEHYDQPIFEGGKQLKDKVYLRMNLTERTANEEEHMKTIRLLYPDHVSGGLDTYYFGANLLQHILPANPGQPVIQVDVKAPDGQEKAVTNGISAEDEVLAGISDAQKKLEAEQPDRIITIGGNCMVSLAPFDYLHGRYENTGIVWIDAHPDVSTVNDGYPNAHAMVLGSLIGYGADQLSAKMKNPKFKPDEILYIGLQPLHDYQEKFLRDVGVNYKVQDQVFVTDGEISDFISRFDQILVHFDIDVLDEHFFHSTYFANPELVGDGAGGGKMTMEKLGKVLKLITENSDVVGFTVAEYLPFDEYRLHKMLSGIKLFTE